MPRRQPALRQPHVPAVSRKRKAPEHSPEPEENHLSMAKRKHEGAEVRLVRARLDVLWERKQQKQRELDELLQRGEAMKDDILVLSEAIRLTKVTLREAEARALDKVLPKHSSPDDGQRPGGGQRPKTE